MADTHIIVPREHPNDPSARLVEWLVGNGESVQRGQAIVLLETTKAAFEVEAQTDGYLFHLQAENAYVLVGDFIGVIRSVAEQPEIETPKPSKEDSEGWLITHQARVMLEKHGIAPMELNVTGNVIRTADVKRFLEHGQSSETSDDRPQYRGVSLDPDADWDRFLDHALQADLLRLRQRMMAKFRRHVPTGTLLNDRWELADALGFGKGSSVYDECEVRGDVTVGKECWIGPFTILDGNDAPLTIGDYTSIGAGSQLYTHHTIDRALTGGVGKLTSMATTIGACCFIGPLTVVAPGTVIGDHSFVASHSFVEGRFSTYSYIAGNPARRIGRVEIRGDKAALIRENSPDASSS